ncbi:hypothetical protein uav_080 [Pseudomonas phage UAVern]|uniref:DUF4326 domain-containing protein n=1 Tax=Pseudomonas phage UAVern TaxID=2856997 RepID=A0A975YZ77_9CAUD|nr:hypothetical protein uav_080 [Pseudomonas phage UAVern]
MAATVVNKYKVNMDDPDIVYIGRGSKWGNVYSHKKGTKAQYWVETREKAVNAYKQLLWHCIKAGQITKEDLLELDGKRLACYCAPQACHGDVLVKAIEWARRENEDRSEQDLQ